MWQLFAFGSLFANAGQSVADKYALITDKKIDTTIATFLRNFVFLILISCVGIWGLLGEIHLSLSPLILLIATVSGIGSYAYTYLLRHVGVLEIGAMGYVLPFVFLAIDTSVLGTHFSGEQIAGMILLVAGGLGFALDGKTHHLNKEFSLAALAMFAMSGISTGVQAYGFKYLHETTGLNGMSFYFSCSVLISTVFLLGIFAYGKTRLLWSRPARIYVPGIAISKSFDVAGSLLWAQALTIAAVSQVSAFSALSPLVLFIVVTGGQLLFRLRLKEQLDRPRALWKASAVCLLVAGGFLVT